MHSVYKLQYSLLLHQLLVTHCLLQKHHNWAYEAMFDNYFALAMHTNHEQHHSGLRHQSG